MSLLDRIIGNALWGNCTGSGQAAAAILGWPTLLPYTLRKKEKEAVDDTREEFLKISGEDAGPEQIVEKAIKYIKQEVENVEKLLPVEERKSFKNVIKTVNSATEAILKSDSYNKQELHHLRLIASTSTLLLIFSHEAKSLLGLLEASTSTLKGLLKK